MLKPIVATAGIVAIAAVRDERGRCERRACRRRFPLRQARCGRAPRGMQTAILAGGCFWGMEAVFEHVKGVKSVVNGL